MPDEPLQKQLPNDIMMSYDITPALYQHYIPRMLVFCPLIHLQLTIYTLGCILHNVLSARYQRDYGIM